MFPGNKKHAAHVSRSDRWLILAIAVVAMQICFGPLLSLGAVFVKMMDTFQTDRAEAAAVQSVHIGVTFSFGLISGALVTKFGPTMVILLASVLVPLGFCISFLARNVLYLCFSIGVISAVGNSMVLISSMVVVERIFEGSQRLLCLALLNTAPVITAIFYPYFLKWLTRLYGLNGMFLILGGLSCNIFVLFSACWTSQTVIQNCSTRFEKTIGTEPGCDQGNTCKEMSYLERLKSTYVLNSKSLLTKAFVFVLLASGLSLGSLDGYLGLMLDITLWKGMSNSQGLTSFVVYYSFTTASGLLAGIIKQKKGVSSLFYPILSALCGCIGSLLINYISNYITYIIGTSLLGIAYGGTISSCINAVVQIVRPEQVPVATGLLSTSEGLFSIGVGPLYGLIRDRSGSYEIVLLTVVCINGICIVLYILALIYHRKQKKGKTEGKSVILVTTRL